MNPSYIDLSPSKPPVYIIPWKSLKLFLNLWLCINICDLLPTSSIKKFSTPNQIPRKRLDWFSWNFVWVLGRSENRPTYIFKHLNDKGDQSLNIFFVTIFFYIWQNNLILVNLSNKYTDNSNYYLLHGNKRDHFLKVLQTSDLPNGV